MIRPEDTWKHDMGEADSKGAVGCKMSASKCGQWENRPEGNPFRGGDGIRKFLELYTGKRRTDRTAWSDYFLSGLFLKNWREEAFAKLMWETVRDYAQEFLPGKEFLTELHIAYGLTRKGDEFQADQNALFPGIEYIAEIARLGPPIRQLKKNDPALQAGFRDYRELLMLSAGGEWDDDQTLRAGKILDYYTLSNISDTPVANALQYEIFQRHPRSIRLLTYFFEHQELPDKIYRLLWNHLHLDTATNGREKLLYGELRRAVAARLPEFAEGPRNSYKELLKDSYVLYRNRKSSTQEERSQVDGYLDRPDVQAAMMDEVFVEEQVLHYWIVKKRDKYVLLKLRDFYEAYPDAPYAGRVLLQISQMLDYNSIIDELLEDEQSGFVQGRFDFQRRAYVRYYLNTAFHLARGAQKPDILLRKYLADYMPYSQKWSQGLAEPKKSGLSSAHPVELLFGNDVLTVFFHQRFLEYRWNNSACVPYFPGEQLADIEDETRFWLLAPISAAPYSAHLNIFQVIQKRLARLPVPAEYQFVIADCITGWICRLDRKDFPVCSIYAEKGEQLYGCDICKDDTLVLYEEEMFQKVTLPNGIYSVQDLDMAVRMGTRLLGELVREPVLDVFMEILPSQILLKIPYHPEKALSGDQITEENIRLLLLEYFDGKIDRMELDYGGHSLLFLRTKQGYGCFWFDHRKQDWYGLVSMPGVYATVDEKDVIYVPFGLGRLPNYLIHQNPEELIRPKLPDIFEQIACSDPYPQMMTWSPQIYRFETRQRYTLAKRLYGGYPASQAHNQLQARFYLPLLPVKMRYKEVQETVSNRVEVGKDKAGVQYRLTSFMWGQLAELSLTWQYELKNTKGYYGEKTMRERHLVLLKEEEHFQMIYMDDERSYVSYLVSDVQEYMKAEGKKHQKETFCGKTVPGYLVHEDLWRIRDHLDLLLSEILNPSAILDRFGEFAYDAKAEYEKLREKYL